MVNFVNKYIFISCNCEFTSCIVTIISLLLFLYFPSHKKMLLKLLILNEFI